MESYSTAQTFEIAQRLGEQAQKGQIYLLEGELGAGKTAFSKGFGKGLGVEEAITSPTFAILNIYEDGRLPLYHFDLYRVDETGVMDLGFEDYFYGEGVCLIEWASNAQSLIPQGYTQIRIHKDLEKGEDYRFIEVVAG